MDVALDGRVALVTGSSSGIGHAAARALAQAGADVCVHGYSHMDAAEALSQEIIAMGKRSIAIRANVSRHEDVNSLVSHVLDHFGRIDILFNNAGIFEMATLEDTSIAMWERHLSVNLTGSFLCTRAVVPHMKTQGRGKVINNGSIFGAYGVKSAVAYCTTKMAIHGMTRALAIELAPYRINVNAVAPGNIVTPLNDVLYDYMADRSGQPGDRQAGKRALVVYYPWGRLGHVTDIANAVVYLSSDLSDFTTGQILFVDGGYSVQ